MWYKFLSYSLIYIIACTAPDNPSAIKFLAPEEINLIPQVKNIQFTKGYFQFDENTKIIAAQEFSNEIHYLQELIQQSSFFQIEKTNTLASKNQKAFKFISFKTDTTLKNQEAYQLNISTKSIEIKAATPQAAMRALQTLRQLFLPAFHHQEKRKAWQVPCLRITDEARFQHRGMLLDVCRHFFDKQVVKKYIDLLAFYKMNVLHFHLTEDQGWRIEIDKYPKLNSISSWRTEADGSRYGGFYTKEDLKEIVEYAATRHITVIPEIELPGHSQAALAAYPEFSCIGKHEKINVVNDWGVFKEIYCAGNDSTFHFLQDILTEVMEIFPSKYIHIGGDEAPKFRWGNCKKCQKRITTEGLHDEHELQSYFITRIERFLNANGKKLIGWDEILEGGLSENATVQSWRGMQGGIDAANSGHEAIMSPTSHCYLDYGLDMIDMKKIYLFDPIPKDLAQDKHKYIIGGECNMWTEHVPDEKTLDSKVNPRMQALAEVLWSYPKERNFDDFYARIQQHYPILKAFKVDYGLEAIPAKIDVSIKDGKVFVLTKPNLKDLSLACKWDRDKTFQNRTEYELKTSGEFQVQAKKSDQAYGDLISQKFEAHLALAKKLTYQTKYNDWYTAGGDQALVDGKIASLNFRDGNWQGYYGNDAMQLIDLGKKSEINSIGINFYQYNNAWIFIPQKLYVQVSKDGKTWKDYGIALPKAKPKQRGKFIEKLLISRQMKGIRFVKIEVENLGKVPQWHEAAGADAWIFMDEIVIH